MNNYISYCTHCGTDVVICGKCGNNCCNGGYGEIFTEVPGVMKVCDQCPSAYLMQEEHYRATNEQLKGETMSKCITTNNVNLEKLGFTNLPKHLTYFKFERLKSPAA